jgi:WD40 repeat protein
MLRAEGWAGRLVRALAAESPGVHGRGGFIDALAARPISEPLPSGAAERRRESSRLPDGASRRQRRLVASFVGPMLAGIAILALPLAVASIFRPIGTPEGPPPIASVEVGTARTAAFSPDGRFLATVTSNGMVQLWEMAAAKMFGTALTGHTGAVSSIAFSPDGKLLATGSADNTVRLWDPATGRPIGTALTGHTGAVSSIAFSPDGKLLATGSADKTVRLWSAIDPARLLALGVLFGHRGPVTTLAFAPSERFLVTGSTDRTVRIWELSDPTSPVLHGTLPVGESVTSISISSDGSRLHTVGVAGSTISWDWPSLGRSTIRLSRGPTAPAGYRYSITVDGFTPNRDVTITCHDSVDQNGFYQFTLHVDSAGRASTNSYCYSGDGPDHWVTADGIESNHVTW